MLRPQGFFGWPATPWMSIVCGLWARPTFCTRRKLVLRSNFVVVVLIFPYMYILYKYIDILYHNSF
jgi:hypothetical protein